MTRKDYQRLAAAIYKAKMDRPKRAVDAGYDAGVARVVEQIMLVLKEDNNRFDPQRFLAAAFRGEAGEPEHDDQPRVLVEVYGGEATERHTGAVEVLIVDWDMVNAEAAELDTEARDWLEEFETIAPDVREFHPKF